MFGALRKKIEAIQGEPEAVRFRYLMICLSVSMLFIVGIWLITVKENFEAISGGTEGVAPLLPDTEIETKSLENLMQGGLEVRPGTAPANDARELPPFPKSQP